jgi:sugar transferase (PEP-CTERM/EpsH1 system associated)
MKMLVVAGDLPASSQMPGSPRLYSLARELSRHHELHLAARCASPERLDWFMREAAAGPVFRSVTVLPSPPAEASWWNRQRHRARMAAYFETRYLHPEYHRETCERVQELAIKEKADLLYVDSLVMAQYVESDQRVPAFIDVHDSLTLLFNRLVKAELRWRRKALLYLQAREVAGLERSLAERFSLVVTNSPVDESMFKRLCPSARTLTIGNGVDTGFFSPSGEAIRPERLVFTGVLGYGPNEDAAIYFCETILPLIREARPEVEFWIVGSAPSPAVRSLGQLPGVHVRGDVPDVRPYLQSAGVFVCPLRVGAGVKNKILAALAMAKPLVATRVSVEGLDLRAEHDLLVADDPRGFADHVIGLLRNPRYGAGLGRNGQTSVRESYSWRASADALDGALRDVMRSVTAHDSGT